MSGLLQSLKVYKSKDKCAALYNLISRLWLVSTCVAQVRRKTYTEVTTF